MFQVTVRPTDSFTSANGMASNGSITNDCVAFATVKACEELLRRLEPVKKDMEKPTWGEVVKTAYNKGENRLTCFISLKILPMTSCDKENV